MSFNNNAFIKKPVLQSIFDLCSSNVQSNDEQSSSTSQLQTKDGDNLCIHGTSTIIKRKFIKEKEENYPQMILNYKVVTAQIDGMIA